MRRTALPRQIRKEYQGDIYHLLSRRDCRKAIFLDELNRHDFIKTLTEICQGSKIHQWRKARK